MSVAFRAKAHEEHKNRRFELPLPRTTWSLREGWRCTEAKVAELKAAA